MLQGEQSDMKNPSASSEGYIPPTPHYYITNLLEALLGGLPVDDLPDCLEVFGLAVLVLETVTTVRACTDDRKIECYILIGVLPSINAENWAEPANDGILVLHVLSV